MSNKNNRKRKASKSDYMRAARKQKMKEDIFWNKLEEQQQELNNPTKYKSQNKNWLGGDDDEG